MTDAIYTVVATLVFGPMSAPRRVMAAERMTICANGKPGYRLEGKGEQYAPTPRCTDAPSLGHIFCHKCRVEAGGL